MQQTWSILDDFPHFNVCAIPTFRFWSEDRDPISMRTMKQSKNSRCKHRLWNIQITYLVIDPVLIAPVNGVQVSSLELRGGNRAQRPFVLPTGHLTAQQWFQFIRFTHEHSWKVNQTTSGMKDIFTVHRYSAATLLYFHLLLSLLPLQVLSNVSLWSQFVINPTLQLTSQTGVQQRCLEGKMKANWKSNNLQYLLLFFCVVTNSYWHFNGLSVIVMWLSCAVGLRCSDVTVFPDLSSLKWQSQTLNHIPEHAEWRPETKHAAVELFWNKTHQLQSVRWRTIVCSFIRP